MNKYLFLTIFITAAFSLYSADIFLIKRDGSMEIKHYDDSTEELYFFKDYTVNIKSLEELKALRRIRFEMTGYLHNFDFLAGLTTVEELHFQDVRFDSIDFLYEMPSLKNLVIQSCKINNKIEISRMRQLEYFEFTNGGLTELPLILDAEKANNIKVINIAYNKITDLNINDNYRDVIIVATNNPIQERGANILFGDLFEALPVE
jgi:Leucine-rich repeat (LRR) protein